MNNNLKILISFLTVICTVCVQVIATFQCFFEDFRTDSADEPGWMIVKFLCLVVSFAKILFGMSIVKHRNGV